MSLAVESAAGVGVEAEVGEQIDLQDFDEALYGVVEFLGAGDRVPARLVSVYNAVGRGQPRVCRSGRLR